MRQGLFDLRLDHVHGRAAAVSGCDHHFDQAVIAQAHAAQDPQLRERNHRDFRVAQIGQRRFDGVQRGSSGRGVHHTPFVYGMPELPRHDGASQRERIAEASAIVAPGCNATAVPLAMAPLLAAGVIAADDISAVLAVGPSGAGRSLRADLLGAELMGSAKPYAVGGTHRHLPEIGQNLELASGLSVSVSMTPVLVPMSRGILATVSAKLASSASASKLRELLCSAYANEPFVRVMELGSFPATADVLGSNTIALGVALDEAVNRVIVVAAIDNLVKGTAGAAVQSMNIALGLPETMGLSANGVAP